MTRLIYGLRRLVIKSRFDGIFYGWVIVATMWAVNFSTMATGNLNFGLFVLPMSNALGMSRSQFGWTQTTRRVSASLSSFVVGRLIDRYGPRIFIPVSAVAIGLCLFLVSKATSPWHIIVLFGVVGVSGLATPNGIVTSVPVAKWFLKKRGKALAIATTGLGIGGIVFLPFTQFLISYLGWRGAWSALAVIFFLIAAPISLIFLRRQPEDMGLTVDGDKVSLDHTIGAEKVNPQAEIQWTVKEALHTGALWKLMFVFAVTGMAQGGASVHRIPYWVELGFDAHTVSYAFSADAAGAATMALISGWLADRFPIRYIAGMSFVGFTVAIFLMICGFNEVFLFASTITFGLSVGAGMVVHSYIFASYFGREFLGAIRGIVMPVNLISAGLGAPIVGYMHDGMGTYTSAWWLLISLYAIGALVVVTVTPPKHPVLGNSPVL